MSASIQMPRIATTQAKPPHTGKLDQSLCDLVSLSKQELKQLWSVAHGTAAPEMSPTLLALGIAHRLQSRRNGGLGSNSTREIERLSAVLAQDGIVSTAPMAVIKPGTALVREWHGSTHHVLVTERGYVYRDAVYGSLSQIARLITGAQWSGPRFFGLKARDAAHRQTREAVVPVKQTRRTVTNIVAASDEQLDRLECNHG